MRPGQRDRGPGGHSGADQAMTQAVGDAGREGRRDAQAGEPAPAREPAPCRVRSRASPSNSRRSGRLP
jgi:hypothetical protein